MSGFDLKIIAILSMLCDHLGYTFFVSPTFFNVIGRIAFPIFAFQISEGYIHTKNLKKYFLRLGCFSVISQIPFMLFLKSANSSVFRLNIFFTIILGLLCITIYDYTKQKYNKEFLSYIPILLLILFGYILKCDYSWYGVTIIFLFYLFKENKLLMNINIIALINIKYLLDFICRPNLYYLYFTFGAISSLIFINQYNKKRGKNIKYLFYIFYPLHLLALVVIKNYFL